MECFDCNNPRCDCLKVHDLTVVADLSLLLPSLKLPKKNVAQRFYVKSVIATHWIWDLGTFAYLGLEGTRTFGAHRKNWTTSRDENSFSTASQNDVIRCYIVIVAVDKISHKHLLVCMTHAYNLNWINVAGYRIPTGVRKGSLESQASWDRPTDCNVTSQFPSYNKQRNITRAQTKC